MQDFRPKLVQIEPRKPGPELTEREIFRKKTYIGFRKIAGVFYSRTFYGTARRWFLSTVLPDKIIYRWKPYRQGECIRCGMCCKIVVHCPFLHEDDQLTACKIYTSEKHAPPPCLAFPFDPRDLADVQRAIAPAICPFTYEGQPEHPTTWGAVKAELRAQWEKRKEKLKEAFNF